MATAREQKGVFSSGFAAELFGVQPWQIQRAIKQHWPGSWARLGGTQFYAIHGEDLPLVRDCLVKAGYLPEGTPVPRGTITDDTADTLERAAKARESNL